MQMSVLSVDPAKCARDGTCIAVCPMGIIEFKEKDAYPAMIDGGDALCISCGHCVAVCPHAAMAHACMQPEDCPPVQEALVLNPAHVEHFLRARRSVRQYKQQAADRQLLVKLIDVARFAPSGHNLQPVHWLVIYERKEVDRLAAMVIDWMRNLIREKSPLAASMHLDRVVATWEAGAERICRGAPHVIVAHGHKDNRAAPAACTIALTYLELAAPSFGLGACWGGYFNTAAAAWPPLAEALRLPVGHLSFGAMMVGYPKFKYQRLPLRKDADIIWR